LHAFGIRPCDGDRVIGGSVFAEQPATTRRRESARDRAGAGSARRDITRRTAAGGVRPIESTSAGCGNGGAGCIRGKTCAAARRHSAGRARAASRTNVP
jgi:hypothetical protein